MSLDRLSNVIAIFLKASAPSDQFDSSEYDEVLYVRGINLGTGRQEVDISNRNSPGNAFYAEFISGQITKQVTLDGIYDLAQETGQQHLIDAIEDDTIQSSGKRWFLATSDISGLEESAGTLIMTQFDVAHNFNEASSFTGTCRISGKPTRQTV